MNLDLRVIALLPALLPLSAAPSPIAFRVDSLTVSDAAADRLHLELTLGVRSRVHLTLKSARFETMRLNGLPLYIAPVVLKLDFDPAIEWRPVRLAPITVYYRDLETLAPLRQLVTDQVAQLEGQARVELDLTLAARVVLPLRQQVPVNVPGGSIGRKAMLTALAAADSTLHFGEEMVNRVRQYFGWTDDLAKQYAPALMVVETRYRYSSKGRTVVRTLRSTAFRIAADRLATTAEALRPWAYDAEAAQLLQSGDAILDDLFYDVRVWPAGVALRDDTALTLHNHRIKVASVGSAVENAVVATGGKIRSVQLGKRDADANVGIVELIGQGPPGAVVRGVANGAQEWDHVAVFRFPSGRPDASVDVVYVKARRKGDRLVLSEPADSTAFGSPLVLPGGAIGMVQDEASGVVFEKLAIAPRGPAGSR
jgi:hypothetical protein